MYCSGGLIVAFVSIGAFTFGVSAKAHRSSGRVFRPTESSSSCFAFIYGQSHIIPSFRSNGAKVSQAVRAKSSSVGETVTKRQLIAEVAQTVEMTQKDVAVVVDEFIKLIGKYLSENKEISIPKFGLFHNSLRGARTMKNLQTGEMYTASPVYVPNLRFYDGIKEEVNQSLKP